MKIHAIGNSHVGVFTGTDVVGVYNDTIPLFKTKAIGPTIAYNFYEHHYPAVLEYVESEHFNKETDHIVLVVGEVDCRWHLLKQAELQNRPIDDVVKECVDRFFRCHLDLQEKGCNVISWGAHPSTVQGHCDILYRPVFGDCIPRNNVAKLWNSCIKEKSDANNIKFISLFDYLIKPDGMTDMSFMADYCHLKTSKVIDFLYKELARVGLAIPFTFGIITNNGTHFDKIIQSIEKQNIPNYEIIIVGQPATPVSGKYIKQVGFDETIKNMWITKKKNLITQHARYENIVYMHDYIVLDDDWYQGWLKYGNDFIACMNPITNLDGSRFRDWTLLQWHIRGLDKNLIIPYTETRMSKHMYFSGSYWVAKKYAMLEFPLDESRIWNQGEDIVWSRQFTSKYEFSINIHSRVYLLKQKDPVFSLFDPEKHGQILETFYARN